MRLSRAIVLAPVPGTDQLLLVQPLSRQVALLEKEEAESFRAARPGGPVPATGHLELLREGRFVVEDDDEEQAIAAEARAEYERELDATPTQLVVVPTLGCNLKCVYCYQEPFDDPARGMMDAGRLDAMFRTIDLRHGNDSPRPYLTLFGGEPLVETPAHRRLLERLLASAADRALTVAVVTNGYDLEGFVPLLAGGPLREVQVTVDGPEQLHDRRRMLKTGGGTFQHVVAGIEAALAAELPVNLRVVVDRENIVGLPELARLAAQRGWLDLPEHRFKTQIGRNYELFGCASRQPSDLLYDRLDLWVEVARLAELNPELRRFHKPRFHGIRHLAETGEIPVPNFDGCPATKKEWAFGPDGYLYGCTATVGNPRFRLGTYDPELRLDETAIAVWRGRNVFSIPKCRDCAVAPMCGGGCGAVAVAHGGDVRTPDCRPVAELMGLGVRYYGLG